MKPLIGITSNYFDALPYAVEAGIGAPGQDWYLLAADYINSVERAGGIPLMLPITEDESVLDRYISLCDGFLISGGNDVSPELYHERITRCGTLYPQRDRFDLHLTQRILSETEKPLFGVCRGCQIFNVALGGTLYQDLPSEGFLPHTVLSFPRNHFSHTVAVAEGSLLHSIVGTDELEVNSFHHQAIRTLAPNAIGSAVSPDHVTEAIELHGHRFFLAVQWHPEMMYDSSVQQRLFSAFINAAR